MKEYTQFRGSNPFGSQAKILFHSKELSDYMNKGTTKGPIFMEINLTSNCNMRCKWCISENFEDGNKLDEEKMEDFFMEYASLGGKAVNFSGGGEPTTHPDFIALALSARKYDIEIGLMTNGVFPESLIECIGNNFKWVRFSVDTFDKVKYKAWKGVDGVDVVVRNIKALKDYPVKVGVNCNVGDEHTIEDCSDLIDFVKDDNARYLQFRPILPRYFNEEGIKLNKTVWEYLEDMNKVFEFINISNDKLEDMKEGGNMFPYESCEGHQFCCVLDSNGDITTCMYHPRDDRFVFGNIYEDHLTDIWSSEKRKEVISFLRDELDMCKECQVCCKLNEVNKLIQFVKYPDKDMDVNFL